MEQHILLSEEEKKSLERLFIKLVRSVGDSIPKEIIEKLRTYVSQTAEHENLKRNVFNIHPMIHALNTALIVSKEIGLKGMGLVSILLHESVLENVLTLQDVEREFGKDAVKIIHGLLKTNELYRRSPVVESENFRNLLLSFAEDMRVILIMIADRVNIMREIRDTDKEEERVQVATEAAYLYAPLAHKLGLYTLKSELEDLSLKYRDRETYNYIKEKLNETKDSREKYIASFIKPIKKELDKTGLKFEIKGRTKTIHSICNKMRKQKTPFDKIYDLFAIRIILDSKYEREKQECWQVYSIITDMYQPNPKRLRDWLSIPKSNGYESLHITVMGPEGRWVEVQIRTERMDDVAERGLAAHWRYKGIKGESGLDEWLTSVREALESSDSENDLGVMDQFKMDLYEDEIFVFTPKGDLYKLGKGATVLDFAFHIHTNLGSQCVGAKVNGKNVPIRYKLSSGDQVEIMTSNAQRPKLDWLNIVTSSKARSKIRKTIKEEQFRLQEYAHEMLARKFKNRKIEHDEAIMMRVIQKSGYKDNTKFYQDIASGELDINHVLDKYIELLHKQENPNEDITYRSAENFDIRYSDEVKPREDVLVIDQDLKGIKFTLAKCCNPIYGDPVFGFVTVSGGIKVHRMDCPNSHQMRERFGYRVIKAKWAGKSEGTQYPITLRVIGHDDIGIITNITSIISKEPQVSLRSVGIDSNDGLFSGNLTILISDTSKLNQLIKKLKGVKGVKQINRA